MATPNAHAVVTASGFERWSHCTAAPRYEEQFPNGSSVYADEGTLAHEVCELHGRKHFTVMTKRKFNAELKKLQANELWQDEMLKTAAFYVDFLSEKANEFPSMPQVFFETRVDLTDYIPEGFGTCDCIMVGGDTLRITDYKHGKGVPVSSINNGQMRLYALGALKYLSPIYGDTLKQVCTAIVQPRITEEVKEEWLTVDELKEWGEAVKPLAQAAFFGMGTFEPGEWCRFCKGKAQCRARAEYNAGFEQFLNQAPANAPAVKPGKDPCLSDAEVADLLTRAAGLVDWYNDLSAYATEAILAGREVPGYKVIEGARKRVFTDNEKALEKMHEQGYDDAILFERTQKSLAEMEKLTGKKAFAEIMGDLITWTKGKPKLVVSSAKGDPYQTAGPNEFAGVTDAKATDD